MAQGTLKFRTFLDPAPVSDEELGQFLVERVRDAIPQRQAGSAIVVVRDKRIDIVGVRELQSASLPTPRDAMAMFSRAQFHDGVDARAVGLIGTFGYRRQPADTPVPTALVFLEWADCRWWQWRGLIDPADNALRVDTETVRRATDGISRPNGLGGWWTRGRHLKGRASFMPHFPPVEDDVVH
ncbi:MAG: hypothetical protein ACJAZO_000301 [Myxococcota bacterium]|jgi:hypothetical protein